MDYFVKLKEPKTHDHKVGPNKTVVENLETGHTFNQIEGSPAQPENEQYKKGEALTEVSTSLSQVSMNDFLHRTRLSEAATTSEFPSQLREDFNVIMLSGYQTIQDVLMGLAYTVNSTKEFETYAGINFLKVTKKMQRRTEPYFTLAPSAKTDVTIYNYKHGGIVEIGEELIMFDKSGEIARLATELGRSCAYERYSEFYTAITTSGNTTAQSSTVTLTPANLEAMLTTYQTQSDTASGKKLGFLADTLLVPAALQWTARRILESAGMPGTANNDVNVMKGIMTLVVCPLLDDNSTTKFYIGNARNVNGLIYQNVIGPNPETFTQDTRQTQASDDCFIYDLIRYKARLDYGIDVIDIRIWHRSTT